MTMRSKQWYTKTSRLEYSFAKSSIGRRSSNRFLTTRSSDRRPVESKFQISLASLDLMEVRRVAGTGERRRARGQELRRRGDDPWSHSGELHADSGRKG